jgi:Uma2 family endonuclease
MSTVFTPTRYRLSVDDYHKLGAAGILKEDSRVELIEGELLEMAPIGSLHAATVARLHELFYEQTRNVALVWQQNPVMLLPQSEPQPDLALLRPRLTTMRKPSLPQSTYCSSSKYPTRRSDTIAARSCAYTLVIMFQSTGL